MGDLHAARRRRGRGPDQKAMAVISGQYVDAKGIISISVKVLPWTFFVSSLRFSVQSLVGNSP